MVLKIIMNWKIIVNWILGLMSADYEWSNRQAYNFLNVFRRANNVNYDVSIIHILPVQIFLALFYICSYVTSHIKCISLFEKACQNWGKSYAFIKEKGFSQKS